MYMDPHASPIRRITRHDALEIGYCHSSSGILLVEDRVEPFRAGDICIMTEQEMHISRSAAGELSYWSYFWMDPALVLAGMPEALSSVKLDSLSRVDLPSIHSPREQPELCCVVRRMIDELKAAREGYHIVVNGLAYELLGLIHRIMQKLPPAPARQESRATRREGVERVASAMHFMVEHYDEHIEVGHLARQCNMGVRNFQRVFRAAIGCSPMQHLAGIRARIAAAILSESDRPVTQVAFAVGYESINAFNRQFKAVFGITPRQYRRQRRD